MQFNRSNLYYKPKGESEERSALPLCCAKNLHIMNPVETEGELRSGIGDFIKFYRSA